MEAATKDTEGIVGFIHNQLLVEVQEAKNPEGNSFGKRLRHNSHDRIVHLAGGLGGTMRGRRDIYLRDCMIDIVEGVLNYFKEKSARLADFRGHLWMWEVSCRYDRCIAAEHTRDDCIVSTSRSNNADDK